MNDRILIVGAGLGGLVAALVLLRQGRQVTVFEQAPELGDVGAGITIYPNAFRVLRHLGLADALNAITVVPDDTGLRHFATGEVLIHTIMGEAARGPDGAPMCFAHRADLHSLLVNAVRAVDADCLVLDHTFVDYRETSDGVEAEFANGARASGSALVGADGIRSAVRDALFGGAPPRFTGKMAWRGLVPADRLDPEVLTPTSSVWSGPDHSFVRYPVRERTLINYVAFAREGEWAEESWKLHSDVAEVLNEFEGWDPRVRSIIAQTPPELCFKWALFDRDPLPEWSRGRATLIGDAAHPTLPFLGQGAAMAFEDGMVLARCLAVEADPAAAFQRYEAARKARGHWVQLESRANGERLFTDPTQRYVDGSERRLRAEADEFRRYDAVTAPV